jgi:deferrochelatase/peroxidase EfeB
VSGAASASPWPLEQIQGFLLRGYKANFARHFALAVAEGDAARDAARDFVLGLTRPGTQGPHITTAMPWTTKPEYCLNVGFTYRGLARFGVPQASLAIFDPISGDPNYAAFGAGMAALAEASPGLNEAGASAPPWEMSDTDFDLLLSIWTDDDQWRDHVTAQIQALSPGTFRELLGDHHVYDGHAFTTKKVYFGFEDSISQPIIKDSPFTRPSDGGQDEADSSAFLIGTGANIYGASAMTPPELGLYGCFGAFLVIRQDVEAFEAQVASVAPDLGAYGVSIFDVQKEALMASMCGRWRNGVSLAVYPINGDNLPPDPPPSPPNPDMRNDFLYVVDGAPDQGNVCPIGSHMRRANMRLRASDPPFPGVSGGFPGGPSSFRRIMRRAMPYQIPYCPEDRDKPGTERGLVGMFLGASLMQQFNFVFGQWINGPFFTDMELADCVMGAPDPLSITVPGMEQPQVGANVTSCVAMRAAAYVFYPGIEGIRYIATVTPEPDGGKAAGA